LIGGKREPENVRFAFVYAVALHDTGQLAQAVHVLEQAITLQPDNPELRVVRELYARESQ
jgi:Flp pilus assembly protein TadD